MGSKYFKILVFQRVFLMWSFSGLKNKGILLSGIGRVNSYFFQKVISWVRLSGWGKKGGIPFISLVFFSHNMVIYQRYLPNQIFFQNQCHFLRHQTCQDLNKIQFQLFMWPNFLCKWPKSWCLPIYIYIYI